MGLNLDPDDESFSEPIPRKGTETPAFSPYPETGKKLFFRTYSPQGDGNRYSRVIQSYSTKGFSEPIPRKGTETG